MSSHSRYTNEILVGQWKGYTSYIHLRTCSGNPIEVVEYTDERGQYVAGPPHPEKEIPFSKYYYKQGCLALTLSTIVAMSILTTPAFLIYGQYIENNAQISCNRPCSIWLCHMRQDQILHYICILHITFPIDCEYILTAYLAATGDFKLDNVEFNLSRWSNICFV